MRAYTGIQETPPNPFERGVFSVSSGYPLPLADLNIGAIKVEGLGFPATSPQSHNLAEQVFSVLTNLRGHSIVNREAKKPDILVLPISGDCSLVVAEAKAAANSTNPAVQNYYDLSTIVERELNFFLFVGRDQIFEDGIESEFSQNFVRIISKYKKIALDNLEKLIESNSVNAEVLSEAVRWLPRIQDISTYNQRLALTTRCLFSPWPRVRDAATLALSSFGDSSAVTALRRAIEREGIDELRADMEQALQYLEFTTSAPSS